MKHVIALFGESGSGKDHILSRVKELYNTTNLINRLLGFKISTTSRPPRRGIKEDYDFVTKENFERMIENHEFVEYQKFNDWYYGTASVSLFDNILNIGIFNIDGIQQLLENKNINVTPVYIHCDDKTRLTRQLTREKNPDIKEIIRRYQADEEDFTTIPFFHLTINNFGNSLITRTESVATESEPQAVWDLISLINMLPSI